MFGMANKKEATKKSSPKIYLGTTIFAIIGTIVYLLLVWLLYPAYLSVISGIIFFVVVWIVYYFIAKSRHKKY